jgi:hypothetical protein
MPKPILEPPGQTEPVTPPPIAVAAHDLLPETWDALMEADTFGFDALVRLHERTQRQIFGEVLDTTDQQALSGVVIEYAGMKMAIALIDPAIDYWSKQVLSHTAGERESRSYKDRVEDLKQLKKDWTAALAGLFLDAQEFLPILPKRVADAPRIVNAGDTVEHVTANPYDIPPMFGPPETIG